MFAVKVENIVFITAVLLIVAVVWINFDFVSVKSTRENRVLAPLPNVNPFHEKFPVKVDMYMNDRVGFRYAAIDFIGKVKPENSSLSLNNKTIVGKNQWLFNNTETETAKDFTRSDKFNEYALNKITKQFLDAEAFAKANGIKLYIMIAPMKHNVYPEYYVEGLKQPPFPSKYQRVQEVLEKANISFIDIFPVLMNAKVEMPILFYKTDTHWNHEAGYIAYYEMMQQIKTNFENIGIIDKNEMTAVTLLEDFEGDLKKNLVSANYNYSEDARIFVPKNETDRDFLFTKLFFPQDSNVFETSNTNAPKVFVLHDSFFDSMHYFALSFSSIVMKRKQGGALLDYKDEILLAKPDIIIWELHERYLAKLGGIVQ